MEEQQTTTPSESTKNKGFIKYIYLIFVIAITCLGVTADVCGLFPNQFSAICKGTQPLQLTLSPNKEVRANDPITLSYSAPNHGYLSLWNWNSQGVIKNMLPVFQLTSSNNHDNLRVRAQSAASLTHLGGMERVVLIWTPNQPNHPTKQTYPTDAEFERAIRAMGRNTIKREAQVQVYASL